MKISRLPGSVTPKLLFTSTVSYSAAVALILMSAVFWQNRMLLLDGANFLAGMINRQGFYLPLGRLAAWPTQVLPVIGLQAGLSLKWTAFAYSINIALFYLAIMLILSFVYRNHRLLLSMAIFLWVFTYDSFYMPVSEIGYGIAYLHLLLAHFEKRSGVDGPGYRPWLILLSLHIILSHPLVIFAVAFCLLFYNFASKNTLPGGVLKSLNILLAAVVILVMVKMLIIGDAELSKAGRIDNFLANYKTLFLDQDANFFFKRYLATSHLPGLLTYLFCSIVLLLRHRFAHFLILQLCSGIFTIIYLASHPAFNPRVFVEIYFLVVAFFVSFCLAFIAFNFRGSWPLYVIAAVIAVQVFRAAGYNEFFNGRTAVHEQIISQMKQHSIQKAAIPFYTAPMDRIMYISGTGHESMLLSMLEDADDVRTFFFVLTDTIRQESLTPSPFDFYNNPWDTADLRSYDLRHFRLDTLTAYKTFVPAYAETAE
jgi:hypothetical protein